MGEISSVAIGRSFAGSGGFDQGAMDVLSIIMRLIGLEIEARRRAGQKPGFPHIPEEQPAILARIDPDVASMPRTASRTRTKPKGKAARAR
jgi:hypothetical protein